MHEATLVSHALQRAIAGWPRQTSASHLRIVVRDTTRVDPESVRFYTGALLRDMGRPELAFDVAAETRRCPDCFHVTHATPVNPICGECGAPLPPLDGPPIVIRSQFVGRRARRCA